MRNKRLAILAVVLALALFVSACSVICPQQAAVVQWITNFTGMEIDTPSGSTHVALDVDQVGSGDIVSFKDGGSEVFDIADGGIADFKNKAPTNLGAAGTDFTSTGGLTLAGPLAVSPGAADTAVTAASTITLSTGYTVITSTTTVTDAVLAACTVAGQVAIITCNVGSGDITITESTTLEAGGSIALDASEEDVVILLCNGTKWLKAGAFADN